MFAIGSIQFLYWMVFICYKHGKNHVHVPIDLIGPVPVFCVQIMF